MWSRQLPVSYAWRNIYTRKLTSLLTAGGMALVVFVFACVLMLAEGIRTTLVQTGDDNNVVVIRKGAGTEIQSAITRAQASILATGFNIASGQNGQPLVARETVVLINLPKRSNNKPSNVTIRGMSEASVEQRPQLRLLAGRWPNPGTAEIATGRSIAQRFIGGGLGESLRFAQRDWSVVGVFDSGGSGFDSEVWGDGEVLMQSFRRPSYSTVIFRMADGSEFESIRQAIESDPRLSLEAKRETQFYADQSAALATFIRILGLSLSVIFSIGAIVGAMITMYASVAARTAEIGTLRALGFQREAIWIAFLVESMMLSVVGGLIGLMAAMAMQSVELSTVNWQTFSEVAFGFKLTSAIAIQSMMFAVTMGVIGGFLPAIRASRLSIVAALRA